ncbi:hypothetical protein AKJ66_02665 [candidate division MSBL1 archaeon SCGC-AAA259E22]|uniref:Uncharacterized protein n=1 Tax=candidate division MSBL1 archaeon SCGC-AAA259E22 TaxID=1698265 RepID=A0A133UG62_9EURY|nr:hypothetical protein AKJ66_02665 [candidate division MSBL1 archaeon SCGC-AAA259E22]
MGSLETRLAKEFLGEKLEEWLGADDENLEKAVEPPVRKGPFRLYYDPSKGAAIEVKGPSGGREGGQSPL